MIGKGIQLSTGFDLNAKAPLDNREWFKTIAERDALPDINLYEGLRCFVEETKHNYQYIDGKWVDKDINNGSGTIISDASDILIKDEYDKFEATNVEGALNELVDKIDNYTPPPIPSEGESIKEIEYGTTEPIDENISIWVDTTNDYGVTTSFSDALILEIMGAISNLNKQVADLKEKNKALEARVTWLELNGGGSGGGNTPNPPDTPDTNDIIMINERREVLTFEDGTVMIFEVPAIEPETYDTVMINENNEVLTFEDGTIMCFDINATEVSIEMVNENYETLTFEDDSIMCFSIEETFDTILINELEEMMMFENEDIMKF